jgi:hypothetical protein
MSERRLKPRLTADQGKQLEGLATLLGLRPAQVAERLLCRKLSRVPLANRALWSELARTRANLTQLRRYLAQLSDPPAELVRLVQDSQEELGAYRLQLLGLSREGDAGLADLEEDAAPTEPDSLEEGL